jgi:glycerophosphoryl diester phosphodiesterase
MGELHGEGVIVNTYTPNKREEMERLISVGVDGIITNEPELLYGLIHQKE